MLLTKTAVGFDPGGEILPRERVARAERVTEFPRIAGEIFLGDQIA